jgi:2-succinyl-6-hydroxy-2,4-cyclohexadiene-1-carboxylate synthase
VPSLHAETRGEGDRTLVLAHGFTQTGRLWGVFGARIGRGRRVVAVDLPGHGGSSEVRADLSQGGRLLLDTAGSGPIELVGYSLGARFALHAALEAPEQVARLVLISGTAGIEDPEERERRRRRDAQLADELEERGDVDAFIRQWLAAPMFATLRGGAAGEDERRRNSAAGLASSLRLAGAGAQEPLWHRLGELTMPVLVLAGATDPRYQALGLRLAAGTGGTFAVVPGAGHAVHLEQPALSARIVGQWLAAGNEA